MRRSELFATFWVFTWALGCEAESYTKLTPPLILINVEAVDFGAIPVGSSVFETVTIANGGQQPLEIGRVTSDGFPVFGVQNPISTIAPSQEAKLVVTFAPPAEGPHTARLTIESNASNAPAKTIDLRGSGVPATTCGDCTNPPLPSCPTSNNLLKYSEIGTCVMGECKYSAEVEACLMGCDPAIRACRGTVVRDAGVADARPADARPDEDARTGADATGGADAGPSDAGHADARAADALPNLCPEDAGVEDSGLGAPLSAFDTPGEHTFVVPAGVTQLHARVWGGGGQGGNQNGATGGGGAFVEARVPVTPGETLDLWVAEGGAAPDRQLGYGGGATYLRRGATDLLIAGGGGGGGSDGNSGMSMSGGRGGAGGMIGEPGGNGVGAIAPFCIQVTGGGGGTQSMGGAGGTNQGTALNKCNGQPGARNIGGRATGVNGNCDSTPGADRWRAGGGQANGGGGGGGAGYYGGGGAGFIWTYCAGGGGGGSSYADPGLLDVVHVSGSGAIQGRATESFGAGRGGTRCLEGFGAPPCTCNAGANGRVEIYAH